MADSETARRRPVNVLAFLLSLVLLAIAGIGLAASPAWLLGWATKWVVAGAIALVGVGVLLTALPARRRGAK